MMTDAEIAGFMNWRGPGAYTQWQMARVRRIVEEVRRREREACAELCEELPAPAEYSDTDKSMWDVTCMDCAAAIRGRHDAP